MPSFEYLLTCLVVVLIPGAGVIYTVSTALMHGRRVGILAALACMLGGEPCPRRPVKAEERFGPAPPKCIVP